MRTEVEGQVQKLMMELFDIEASLVVAEARIREELGADSLDIVELIIALSNHFVINVRDAEVQKIRTVGDIVTYIDQKLVVSQSAPVYKIRANRLATAKLVPA